MDDAAPEVAAPEVDADAEPSPATRWWASGAVVAVVLGWAILTPTWRAPDEPHHVDLLRAVGEDLRYPAWDERPLARAVLDTFPWVQFQAGSAHLEEAEAPTRSQRPSFEELTTDPPAFSPQANQMAQHPPLYYAATGLVQRALVAVGVGETMAFDAEVLVYRLLSVAMVVGLPLAIWALGRELGLPWPVRLAACTLPLAIPQFTHIASVVNNDNLFNLWCWLAAVPMLRLARGDVSRRTAALAGLTCGLALFTKGTGLVLPVWLAASVALGMRARGTASAPGVPAATVAAAARRAVRPLAVGLGLALAAGGWWWVRNVVVFGELAPSTEYDRLGDAPPTFQPDLGDFLDVAAARLNQRFWGSFGWLEVQLPGPMVVGATAALVLLVAIGLLAAPRQGARRAEVACLLAPAVLLLGFVLLNAWRLYAASGQLPLLQGRYLYGGLPGIAVVAAMGGRALLGRWHRVLPLLVLAATAAAQGAALAAVSGRFWGPPGAAWSDRLRAMVAWSPAPPALDALILVAVAAGWLVLVVLAVRAASGRSGGRSIPSRPA